MYKSLNEFQSKQVATSEAIVECDAQPDVGGQQIEIVTDANAGTVALFVMGRKNTAYESLNENGSPIVLNLAEDTRTAFAEGSVKKVKGVLTSLNGTVIQLFVTGED